MTVSILTVFRQFIRGPGCYTKEHVLRRSGIQDHKKFKFPGQDISCLAVKWLNICCFCFTFFGIFSILTNSVLSVILMVNPTINLRWDSQQSKVLLSFKRIIDTFFSNVLRGRISWISFVLFEWKVCTKFSKFVSKCNSVISFIRVKFYTALIMMMFFIEKLKFCWSFIF